MVYQDKIMFEIYQDSTYTKEFRVIYFSELDDHNRDKEIDRAMLGEHLYDGFFPTLRKEQAKQGIDRIVAQLNHAGSFNLDDLKQKLSKIIIND